MKGWSKMKSNDFMPIQCRKCDKRKTEKYTDCKYYKACFKGEKNQIWDVNDIARFESVK